MLRSGGGTALAAVFALVCLADEAIAAVTIDSLGDQPLTLERIDGEDDDAGLVVSGGKGATLHIGGITLNSGGGSSTIYTTALRPPLESGFARVTVEFSVDAPTGDKLTGPADRVSALTSQIGGLAETVMRQCELAAPVLGARCQVDKTYFRTKLKQDDDKRNGDSVSGRAVLKIALPKSSAN